MAPDRTTPSARLPSPFTSSYTVPLMFTPTVTSNVGAATIA